MRDDAGFRAGQAVDNIGLSSFVFSSELVVVVVVAVVVCNVKQAANFGAWELWWSLDRSSGDFGGVLR